MTTTPDGAFAKRLKNLCERADRMLEQAKGISDDFPCKDDLVNGLLTGSYMLHAAYRTMEGLGG